LLDHRVFVSNGYSERCRLHTSDQQNIESAPIEHPKWWFTVAAPRFIWHRDKKGNIEGFREAMVSFFAAYGRLCWPPRFRHRTIFLLQADFVFNAKPLHRNFVTTGFFRTVYLKLMYSVYRLQNSVGE
jgi:hypothetical protein